MSLFHIIDECDVLLRYDENVDRRLRVQVAKRNHVLIIINDVARYLVCRDATKNAAAHIDLTAT